MKKADFILEMEIYNCVLQMQDAKGSTGSMGKRYDPIVRNDLLKKGISSKADVRCRKQGRPDVRTKAEGIIEVKTGSGPVFYGDGLTKADILPKNILPDASLIAWAPWSRHLPTLPTTDSEVTCYRRSFWVLTRAEFIDILEAIGKNGLLSSVKVASGGRQLNIQTISAKLEERLMDELEKYPTLEEYLNNRMGH